MMKMTEQQEIKILELMSEFHKERNNPLGDERVVLRELHQVLTEVFRD